MGLSVRLLKAVNRFTLDVEWTTDNELAVLFGYSGAGKSLTLQLIAGLLEPDEGSVSLNRRVLFDSHSHISVSPQQRSLGYVFQDLALFPHMTLMENILYGAKGLPKDERKAKAQDIIKTFRLDGLEARFPSEISGGQKQRVALARALIRKPDVLLLDEPFSALDKPLRIEMRRFLKDVRMMFEVPVILVTHDIAEAFTLADKMIVYVNGRVAQVGTIQEICSNPTNADVETLVNAKESDF